MTEHTSLSRTVTLSPEETLQLELLRTYRRAHRQQLAHKEQTQQAHLEIAPPTRGQRLADRVAAAIGSWRFIIVQSTMMAIWITGNVLSGSGAWDPYPFILLNLLLSFQAAYTAPAIMMSQNRQSELDRRHAQNDYEINVKAELEIELLHEKIDLMREKELLALTEAVRDLTAQVQTISSRSREPN